MTINVLWIILAFTIGLGTGQSIAGGDATAEPNSVPETGCYIDGTWYNPCPETHCYINGIWYNPCPSDPEPRDRDPFRQPDQP